jgi:hypothetical protein
LLKVVIEFCAAPTQITPFVSKLPIIVAEFDEPAKHEVLQEVKLTFYVAWEFSFP